MTNTRGAQEGAWVAASPGSSSLDTEVGIPELEGTVQPLASGQRRTLKSFKTKSAAYSV